MQFPIENIIARLRSGDEAAFKLVYDEHAGRVYGLAFRFLKNREQAEEIVQEVFVKLWLNKIKLDITGNLWLYLYVIAKRLCLNELKKVAQSRDLFNKLMQDIEAADDNTQNLVAFAELEKISSEVIALLPKQQKKIFLLSRLDGLSHKEIAEKLSLSPHTVKNHMVEALRLIRCKLRQEDIVFLLVVLFL